MIQCISARAFYTLLIWGTQLVPPCNWHYQDLYQNCTGVPGHHLGAVQCYYHSNDTVSLAPPAQVTEEWQGPHHLQIPGQPRNTAKKLHIAYWLSPVLYSFATFTLHRFEAL